MNRADMKPIDAQSHEHSDRAPPSPTTSTTTTTTISPPTMTKQCNHIDEMANNVIASTKTTTVESASTTDHNTDQQNGLNGLPLCCDHIVCDRTNPTDENDNENNNTLTNADADFDESVVSANLELGLTVINHCAATESNAAELAADAAADLAKSARHGSETGTSSEQQQQQRASIGSHRSQRPPRSKTVIKKFQKLDSSQLSSTPAPNVKIGQRVAYKEYYGNEFGTIRWIGRVPQISPDWTVGVEFDNAIGEGDGSLQGRRYFIAKDCFAKFLPLNSVALVDQHVGRPEPGTMISVMAAASQPGQMISIQRVSTVHVQHCFLNAPHSRRPGADILAVNTRLHCQCPNCGPCAHVIKPPTTQRLARAGKNATHMCQFSTYTCCGMESQEETMCTYTGNRVVSDLPPDGPSLLPPPPPIGNSWIEGAGYLSQLQAQQRKLMPEEYILGAAPEDCGDIGRQRLSRSSSSRRGSGKQQHHVTDKTDQPEAATPTNSNHQTMGAKKWVPPAGQQEEAAAATNDHYTVACGPDKSNHNSYKLHLPTDESEHASGTAPRTAKVFYRNSIENRYLFPTDEPIDPSLEEDLENLSQARYGYATQQQSNGLRGSSRGLFKSLRSLVSCLNNSQQSRRSDFDEVQSENTFRYSSSQNAAAHFNKNTSGQEAALYENMPPPPLYSSSKSTEHPDNCGPEFRCQHLFSDTQAGTAAAASMGRQISSSSDCGFSSASQNSINCLSFAAMSQASPLLEDHLRSQQIYRRIVARMMNNPMVSDEDMERLRSVFVSVGGAAAGSPFDAGCCLHAGGQTAPAVLSAAELDQTIAEIASRSLQLQKDKDSPRACCFHSKGSCCSGEIEAGPAGRCGGTDGDKLMTAVAEANKTACCVHGANNPGAQTSIRRHKEGSIASDSITLSSLGSSSGNASTGAPASSDQQQQSGLRAEASMGSDKAAANLPKAFELKLTLSINSDGKNKPGSLADSEEQPVPSVTCKLNKVADPDDCRQAAGSMQVLDIEIRSPDERSQATPIAPLSEQRPVELKG